MRSFQSSQFKPTETDKWVPISELTHLQPLVFSHCFLLKKFRNSPIYLLLKLSAAVLWIIAGQRQVTASETDFVSFTSIPADLHLVEYCKPLSHLRFSGRLALCYEHCSTYLPTLALLHIVCSVPCIAVSTLKQYQARTFALSTPTSCLGVQCKRAEIQRFLEVQKTE